MNDMDMDKDLAIRLWDETERGVHLRGAPYEKDPSSFWIEPFRIFGNLYYVGDRVVCVHLLVTGEGLVLFDSGFPHAADQLFKSVRAAGFSPSDIRHVFHTHEHYDHFGASRRLQTEFGTRTYLHVNGVDVFRLKPHHTEIQSAHFPDASLFIPDVALKDGDSVNVGDYRILCRHTPGHSAGAAGYHFDLEENGRRARTAICGVNGNLPLHPGRLLKYGIPLDSGQEYLASIDTMMELEVDLALDTHPRPGGIVDRRLSGTMDYLDSRLWQRNLQDYRRRYQDMIMNFEAKMGDPAQQA